jgi:hypothetical protein
MRDILCISRGLRDTPAPVKTKQQLKVSLINCMVWEGVKTKQQLKVSLINY